MNDIAPIFNHPALPPRFWRKVQPDANGCWTWVAAIQSAGYGCFSIKNTSHLAHRVSYTNLVGPIPDGLLLDHLCRVRNCVNPAHLEPVTSQINTLRGETLAAACVKVTECPTGHPYDDANTTYFRGKRRCRACARDRATAKRAKLAAVKS